MNALACLGPQVFQDLVDDSDIDLHGVLDVVLHLLHVVRVKVLRQEIPRNLIDLFQVILADVFKLIYDSLLEVLKVGVVDLIEGFC